MPHIRPSASAVFSSTTRLLALGSAVFQLSACAGGLGSGDAEWPPVGKKWFDRAEASFRHGDMEDARLAIDNALRVVPEREEPRLLSAKVALAELEYDRAVAALRGLESSEARSVRGRAHWYAGDVDRAADELDKLLSDPEVRDPWAAQISRLARLGTGRKPFDVSGGLLAVTEMPRAGTTALIVPLELNGEPALGLIATGTAEAVIDSSGGAGPSWVSLRFGERVEVRDVPALADDLSGVSRYVNAPIKILLGVNVLRHLRPTFDFAGGQFIVRTFDPPPPPVATTVKLSYVRGGGMLMRGAFSADQAALPSSFLVDTTRTFAVALDENGWKKAGVAEQSLRPVPGSDLRQGVLPFLRIGALDLPGVPGVSGETAVKDQEDRLGIEIDGLVGSGLLAYFRVTLVDGGRTMWLEDLPREAVERSAVLDAPSDLPEEAEPDTVEEEAPAKPPAPGTKPGAAPSKPAPASPAPTAPAPAAPAPKPPAATPAPKAPAAPAVPQNAAPGAASKTPAAPAVTKGSAP